MTAGRPSRGGEAVRGLVGRAASGSNCEAGGSPAAMFLKAAVAAPFVALRPDQNLAFFIDFLPLAVE
jgi:hypothetical protein